MDLRRAEATKDDNNHSKIHLGLHVYTKLSDSLISEYLKEKT